MDEGCLWFILEVLGNFLFEILGWLWQSTWDFSSGLGAWLYREGPAAVRMGARLGALAGCLWGMGLGLRFCPAGIVPPAVSAMVLALLVTPILGLVGGLVGWGCSRVGVGR